MSLLKVFLFISLLCFFIGFTQTEDSFFTIKNDSVILYLSNTGNVTTKSKSKYYRIANFDKTKFIYKNKVIDFFVDGKVAFEQEIKDGLFHGNQIQYYEDGTLHHKGSFHNSERIGNWKYYHPNGNIEKEINFDFDIPKIINSYSKSGKLNVLNGNGKFKGEIIIGHKSLTKYIVKGKVEKGLPEGWWNYLGGKELFKNGKFLKGKSLWKEYNDEPAITMTGFNLHDEATIFRFIAIPKTNKTEFKIKELLKYNGSIALGIDFNRDFTDYLSLPRNSNFWSFVQFKVTQSNQLENIHVYSNNLEFTKKVKKFFKDNDKFSAPISEDRITECSVYINFIVENGSINIPNYSFYSDINLMGILPKN